MFENINDQTLREQAERVCAHPNMNYFQFHEKAGQVEDGFLYSWDGTLWSVACMDRDMIAYFQAVRGMSDPEEIWAFLEVLKEHPGGPLTIMEAGAGGGVMGMHAMNFHTETRAVMVEAHPGHFRATQENLGKNGFSERGLVLHAAVGAEAGRVVKFTDEGYGSNIDQAGKFLATQVTVGSLMLDLSLDNLDILHMDVQGAEVNVLYGAEEELRQGRIKHVLIGTHSDGLQAMARNFLEDCGYCITVDVKPSESICADGVLAAKTKNNGQGLAGSPQDKPAGPEQRFQPDLNDIWIRKHFELLAEPFLARLRDRSSLYMAIPAAWVSSAIDASGVANFNYDQGKVKLVLNVDGNIVSPSGRGSFHFRRSLAVYNEIPNLYGGAGVLIVPLDYRDVSGVPGSYHINTRNFKAESLDLEMNSTKDKRRWLVIKQ